MAIGNQPLGNYPIGNTTVNYYQGNQKMAIPIESIISVNPGVIQPATGSLSLSGVVLTQNTLIPTNAPLPFYSAAAVGSFFGTSSTEYAVAQIYFNGYNNSTIKPSTLWFSPYCASNRAAWLQSGNIDAAYTIAELQAFSGTIIITVNGTTYTSSTINLSGYSTQSAMAAAIQAAFTTPPFTVTYDSVVTHGFTITNSSSGASSTTTFATGTLASNLLLTQATGATISQGANADTPATAMATLIAGTQNWVSFTTLWEPDLSTKKAFAACNNSQNQRYSYVVWDSDAQAVTANSTSCLGYYVNNLNYDGIIPIAADLATVSAEGTTLATALLNAAAFCMGTIASIDTSRLNGRITLAFKSQSGMYPTIADDTNAQNAINNGYNFYGQYSEVNSDFDFFYPGQISGRWKWIDTYVNQIWLNTNFKSALASLLTQINSIPYNNQGYSLIRLALQDPINSALNFGAIRKGVELSKSEIAMVNSAAGVNAAAAIMNQGYYLQILDPGATARATRNTPIINFWYTDGSAIQMINLSSVDIM
jgi:Protein of unknown function (DUF3383)